MFSGLCEMTISNGNGVPIQYTILHHTLHRLLLAYLATQSFDLFWSLSFNEQKME